MNSTSKKTIKASNLIRFKEHKFFSQDLQSISLFPYNNIYLKTKIFRAILNFSFKDIDFNKKKALPFFLAVELLTNQKCVATLSRKNIMAWKLRKGALVGCKVTLRKNNLFEFFDSLILALPRMEKFVPINITKSKKKMTNSLPLRITELVLFFPIELGLGVNTEVKKVETNFIFNKYSTEEQTFILTSNKIPVNAEWAQI